MKNKLTLGIKFVILVVMLFIFGSVSLQVEAKELNQTGFVDDFQISPTSYWFNDIGQLTIQLSEKSDNKIYEGDTLTLSAPENMEFTYFSEEQPLELIEGGIVYGTGVTNGALNQLVITFNENVNNYSGFKGVLKLSVIAGYVTPEVVNETKTIHYETNLGTNLQMKNYDISNRKTEGSYPYFYKPRGRVYNERPNEVYWEFHINRSGDPLATETKVIDSLHPGQVLPRIDKMLDTLINNTSINDFRIEMKTIDGSNILTTISVDEFINSNYGEVNFINEREFEFIAYQETLRNYSVSVKYYTDMTPEGKYQKYFYNDAVGKYINSSTGLPETNSQLNLRAENLFNSGVIAPEKGVLRIIKLAKHEGQTKPLGNVTFKLFHKDGTPVDFLGNSLLETDSSGRVDTPFLNPGEYYVTEITAPDFVVFDKDEQYHFTIREGDAEGVILAIGNELKTIDIPVEKIWKGSSEEHPTIKINLLANNKVIDSVELVSGQTTHTFTKLPLTDLSGNPIEYEVSEENVPGYISEVTGTVENGFTVTNSPKGEFTATKEASEQVLKPGEKFTYTITVTNTVEGSILKNLLVEDNMPDGIQIDGNLRLNGEAVDEIIGNGFKVTIPELKGNEIATIKVDAVVKEDASESKPVNIAKITDPEDPDNPKEPPAEVEIIRETDLRLLKTGMDGKTVLKDAVFELYQLVDGKEELLLSYTTDNVGHINFTKLKSGTYIIKEKIAPNGYQLLEESITLTIDKKGILSLVDSLKGMVSLDKVANEFQLTIKNEEEPTKGILPQTGGNGHLGYTKTALLLMIIGSSLFGYYWYRSRKGWQS